VNAPPPTTTPVAPAELAYERHGQRVSREAFYRLACDPRRHVAVEACAGAGKTWMLVSRMLRALLDGAEPQDILAITFTRKAAGEMRQRLQQWLQSFAGALPEALARELRLRGVDEARLPAQAQALAALQRRVLDGGRSVDIRTFHGWFASLLRGAPVAMLQRLGLPLQHELLERDDEAVARVWRPFLQAVRDDASLRADFEASVAEHGRHQTLKALENALSRRIEFAMADAAGRVSGGVAPFGEVCPAFAGLAHPDRAFDAGTRARAVMREAADWLLAQRGATARKQGEALARALEADTPDAAALDAMALALLTQKGEPRKLGDDPTVTAAQQLLSDWNDARAQAAAEAHQARMARLTRCLLAEYAALKRARGWIDMNDVERAAREVLADPELGGWLQERLDARVRHLLIDEFQDTNPLQWQALHAWLSSYAGAGQSPSLFIVGDPKQSIYRFRRAEPQVFRAAQDFVRELGGELLSCDHTHRNAPAVLACVNTVLGGAQQAGRYEGFRAHTTESTRPGRVARLPAIARDAVAPPSSAPGAPAWRDSLTTPAVQAEDSLRRLEARQAARFIAARLVGEGGDVGGDVCGHVRGHHSTDGEHGTGGTTNTAGTPMQPRDFMVLARRREPLAWMQEALRELHVPAQLADRRELGDAPEVQDLVALVDALVSPTHNLSLARALRSPLFGLSDEDLIRIAQAVAATASPGTGTQITAAQGTAVQAPATQATVNVAIEPRARPSWLAALTGPEADALLGPTLADVGRRLVRWQSWLRDLPPHDALAEIYRDGAVIERFARAAPPALRGGMVANLQALLGAALDIDAGRYLTAYGFVRALRRGGLPAPAVASDNAVQLLTVHGAKGLEARVVLLLDTDAQATRAETMGVLVDWPGEAPAPARFVFLARESRPPLCARELLAREKQERDREELNALYVALTRAEQELVFSSTEPYTAAPASWWQQVLPLAEPLEAHAPGAAGPKAPQADAPDAGAGGSFRLPVLPAWVGRASSSSVQMPMDGAMDAAIETPTKAANGDSAASRIGQAMHRLLEWMALPSAADTENEARAAHAGDAAPAAGDFIGANAARAQAAVAREFALDADELARAVSLAQRIRGGEAAWIWDATRVAWAGNEVTLHHRGEVLRIDRLLREAGSGHWWVLDYKSALAPERQQDLVDQLRRYRLAVQAARPGETVRCAFITGDGAWREMD
jgi:ATP-dependent helicase/nuclease subunit A